MKLSLLSLIPLLVNCGKPRKAFPRKGPIVDELDEILGGSRVSYHDKNNAESEQQVIYLSSKNEVSYGFKYVAFAYFSSSL